MSQDLLCSGLMEHQGKESHPYCLLYEPVGAVGLVDVQQCYEVT